MHPEYGARITWAELPEHVRMGVEDILGSRVIDTRAQLGGFSPGTADRVRTIAGGRAFVKAAHPGLNAETPALHRQEARVSAALPHDLPTAALIGTYDDGDWVAIVLEDIEGRHPRLPWDGGELALVLDAIETLAGTEVPAQLRGLPGLADELREPFIGWVRIKHTPPAQLDPWVAAHLDELIHLAQLGNRAMHGEALVHGDVRADNILITADRGAVLVDWPWANIGAGWFDALTTVVNARVYEPDLDADALVQSHPVFDAATPTAIDGCLAGLGAYFLDTARRPPPPGLPTVRDFQRRQGEAVIAWLRERWDPRPSSAP